MALWKKVTAQRSWYLESILFLCARFRDNLSFITIPSLHCHLSASFWRESECDPYLLWRRERHQSSNLEEQMYTDQKEMTQSPFIEERMTRQPFYLIVTMIHHTWILSSLLIKFTYFYSYRHLRHFTSFKNYIKFKDMSICEDHILYYHMIIIINEIPLRVRGRQIERKV